MATRFEIIIPGQTEEYAQGAALAAFDLLERLEQKLSRFIHVSDVTRINALQAGEAIRLGEAAFECLATAMQVWRETGGAFDATLGALKDNWGRSGTERRRGRAAAQALRGMERLELHKDECEVLLNGQPVSLDLGGIGKGYAVDKMVESLKEWSISTALVHGGESSIYGLGAPPSSGDRQPISKQPVYPGRLPAGGVSPRPGWKVAAANPKRPAQALKTVLLRDRSLSASSLVGDPHILDPRTGSPVKGRLGAWSLAPTAALADALSTAFMVMSPDEIAAYCQRHPECAALCATRKGSSVGIQGWNWPMD